MTTPTPTTCHRCGAIPNATLCPVSSVISIRRLSIVAGSKAEVARACNVSLRTVGYWRSGKTDKVPFAAVLVLASLCGCPIERVRP